jgi:RimJ/RimL family protein N-acetyltransferase
MGKRSRGPAEGVELELNDGSWVCIRGIKPGDRDALARGFERLSEDSRYRRFLTPMERLTQSQLDYLTTVDHHDHEAVVALDLARPGELVGVGRYVREGEGSDRAEAAVTVADDWQGKGLGTALTRILGGRAADEGITRFTALLLADNDAMVALLDDLGKVEVTDRDGDAVEVDVPLEPEVTGDPALRGVLRAVATTPIDLAKPPGEEAGAG